MDEYALAKKVLTQRDAWPHLLRDLNSKMPQGMWITELKPLYNGESVRSDTQICALASARVSLPDPASGTQPSRSEGFVGAPEINQIQIKGLFENSDSGESNRRRFYESTT